MTTELKTGGALPSGKELIMAKVVFGNHTAVLAARAEQDRIRKFYCDVLGGKVRMRADRTPLARPRICNHLFAGGDSVPDADRAAAVQRRIDAGDA